MAELDLIPSDYRRLRALRSWLARAAVAYLALLAVLILCRAALAFGVSSRSAQLALLDIALAREQGQQAQLAALQQQRDAAQQNLRILEGLRGGVAAVEVFQVIDRAADPTVWFLDWKFRRAGEIVEKDAVGVQTGYFIVLPPESRAPNEARERGWLLQTHMQIHAQARDHSSLAGFVRRLVEQPEIAEARVLETSTARQGAAEVIDFELAVVVRTRA